MAYDFDIIASNYDRMNRLMTLGLDRRWRERAVRGLQGNVLDVACGTGDMVVGLAKQGCTVTGIDISEEMLAIARRKTAAAAPHLSPPTFHLGDAEALPFSDDTFDAVTCAFGVRNFVHLEQGLREMHRVLRPGGRAVVLELSVPRAPLVQAFYNLYARRIIPLLGAAVAGNREAYTYLPESIRRFPTPNRFAELLRQVGFASVRLHPLTLGVCHLYVADKCGPS